VSCVENGEVIAFGLLVVEKVSDHVGIGTGIPRQGNALIASDGKTGGDTKQDASHACEWSHGRPDSTDAFRNFQNYSSRRGGLLLPWEIVTRHGPWSLHRRTVI